MPSELGGFISSKRTSLMLLRRPHDLLEPFSCLGDNAIKADTPHLLPLPPGSSSP